MGKLEVKLNIAGVDALRKSPQMQAILSQYGTEKALQAGDGYKSSVHVFSKRAVANIYAATDEALQDNFDNNTLLKVLK